MKALSDVEYASDALVIDNADVASAVHRGTVRKVYGLLCVQLCFTAGMVAAATSRPDVLAVVTHPAVAATSAIVSISAVCATPCVAHRWPSNLLLLGTVTATLSVPVAAVAALAPPQCIVAALGGTAGAFLGAMALVSASVRMPTACEQWLAMATLAALPMALLQHLWLPASSAVIAWGGVVLFTAWIVYDVDVLCRRATVDDAVVAALHLYLDLVNLFLCVLQIATDGARD